MPHTAMAVAIDIGEAMDIHPKNKQDVGRRLALAALGTVYGRDVVFSGPMYRSHSVEGDAVRVEFDHLGGGLEARGGALKGFTIAGEDRRFVWADAEIDGDAVVVRSSGIATPAAVRYAWAANPDCNLYNRAGLPAVPFRTDDWPGVTQHEN
jgi:sialate O-acetylesterase